MMVAPFCSPALRAASKLPPSLRARKPKWG
jgi:hypothetical protein